jgi:hypothetical protein
MFSPLQSGTLKRDNLSAYGYTTIVKLNYQLGTSQRLPLLFPCGSDLNGCWGLRPGAAIAGQEIRQESGL